MRFSLNFVQEFFPVNIAPRQLAERLTMAGMEVEALTKAGNDWLFDIEVTTNRCDWLSIVGIVREISAVLGRKLKLNYPLLKKEIPHPERDVIIEASSDCSYYIGRLIKGVKVKNSLAWLKQRILNCNLTSVNNIVDITNYCMLKWGNPLHAFDDDKLKGNICIRRAKRKESFLGIDNKEYILDKVNLVIADEEKVIALAGVMGAKNSEVDQTTKNIFLEAALFSPLTVRRSRRQAGCDTESSYRFERKVNPEYLEIASGEAVQLMQELSQGTYGGFRRAGKKSKILSKKIFLNLWSLNNYLGALIPKQKAKHILSSLGFSCKEASKNRLLVLPPFWRFDIREAVDVYEEISRIYGYEKITAKIPFLKPSQDDSKRDTQNNIYSFKNELSGYLALLGFKEIVTYSIEDPLKLQKPKDQQRIIITNPLRKNENALRNSLVLGMLESISYNLNRNQSVGGFFEIAHIYFKDEKTFFEIPALALGKSSQAGDFFSLKGAIEQILGYLDIKDFRFQEKSQEGFQNALEIIAGNQTLGFLGKLDNFLRNSFNLKEDIFFSQIGLSKLIKIRGSKRYWPLSLYPAVYRDISISLPKDIKFKEIEELIRKKSLYFTVLKVIDIYKGKNVASGFKAFTLRVFYQSQSKTLTSQEVDVFHNKIRDSLSQKAGIVLR